MPDDTDRDQVPSPAGALMGGIAVRVCAVILQGREMCVIHRERPDGDQYSLPGGLVSPQEDLSKALARELREELGLDVTSLPSAPRLLWVQDQITTRPGAGTGGQPFRRLHLIHLLRVPLNVRRTLAGAELDAKDPTRVVWVDVVRAAGLHLYPAVGDALASLPGPATATTVLLPPITDLTFRWR
ncbi:NUDIX domain-containing protein [Kitasatospora indigofera]|uniref:NUDIX domain-containing protein n=1 Tax=Kitasatospora indigofera TaxID=67307 RepID=UPI0033B9CA20